MQDNVGNVNFRNIQIDVNRVTNNYPKIYGSLWEHFINFNF